MCVTRRLTALPATDRGSSKRLIRTFVSTMTRALGIRFQKSSELAFGQSLDGRLGANAIAKRLKVGYRHAAQAVVFLRRNQYGF